MINYILAMLILKKHLRKLLTLEDTKNIYLLENYFSKIPQQSTNTGRQYVIGSKLLLS